MTAPVEQDVEPVQVVDEDQADTGEMRVRLPVVVLEGVTTSDGRYLTPGGITHRALPISLLACPENAHGGQDPAAAQVIGRIDSLTRHHGPDVLSPRTGEPFPDGVFVWSGEGAIQSDHPIADLVRRRYLRGVSVDLAGMDVEMIGDDDALTDADHPARRMIAHSAEVAAVTLVAVPAFGDAYIELADQAGDVDAPVLTAAAFPAWRSAEVGDYPALVAAAAEAHTGGMIALVPADPEQLTVDGGLPTDELHLTLAYLGDDVTGWDDEARSGLLGEMEQVAARLGAVEAEVMGHALFNPTGAHDRKPCAVHLVSGPGLAEAKAAVANHDQSEHPIFLPHITGGYGIDVSALSYVGPVRFDRLRVALADDVTDYPLTMTEPGTAAEPAEAPIAASAADTAFAGHDLIFYKNRSTPKVVSRGAKAPDVPESYGPVVSRRKATAEEEKTIARGDWVRVDSSGRKPGESGYDKSKVRPNLSAELAEPVGETDPDGMGIPDAPQPCQFGDHPAVKALLFDEDTLYLPVCADDEQQGLDLIAQNGATVTSVVDIPDEQAQPETEEMPA